MLSKFFVFKPFLKQISFTITGEPPKMVLILIIRGSLIRSINTFAQVMFTLALLLLYEPKRLLLSLCSSIAVGWSDTKNKTMLL